MEGFEILAFADGSPSGLARAAMAARLARGRARLTISLPSILPMKPYGPGAWVMAGAYDEAARMARAEANEALAALREETAREGVEALLVPEEIDLNLAQSLAGARGRCADLIILGQPIKEDASPLDTMLLEGALFRSGRPCLILPRWEEVRPFGTRALIAWSETSEAARAAHDALPLLRQAQAARLVHVGEDGAAEPDGLADVAAHLARRGAPLEPAPTIARGDKVGETLLTEVERFGADLLVMGGYGRSRLRELVFGGATRDLLRASPIAMLMSH